MIVDLVSPWLAALESTAPARGQEVFRSRHAGMLEALRLARAPTFTQLPLMTDLARLRPLARRAADPATQQLLRDTLTRAAELGADRCTRLVLVASDSTGGAVEAIPRPEAELALFVEQVEDDDALIAALARGTAALARWSAADSESPVARERGTPWNRWECAQNVALREWIYTDGVGSHVAAAILPDLAPHRLLQLNGAAYNRLREREKILRAMLDADLDQRAIGLVLRWLMPDAPTGPRTVGDMVLPPMTGRYLAWRMTSERVARAGLRESIRAEA